MSHTLDPIREYRDAQGNLLAVVIRRSLKPQGVQFVTAPELSQQVACICWPDGHVIPAHYHRPVPRDSYQPTQEVLFLRSGHLKMALYDARQTFMAEVDLFGGDVALLVSGGHGFQVVGGVEMYEAKQGPYNARDDKVQFVMSRPCHVCDALTVHTDNWGNPVCSEHRSADTDHA